MDSWDIPGLRDRLGLMTSRIVFRLEDRSFFPVNSAVYQKPSPITGQRHCSFLEFAITGLESFHATLGRFEYPDQYPLLSCTLPESPVKREIHVPALPYVPIDLSNQMLDFYVGTILPALCEKPDDPDTYGETVNLDADLLEILHERINIGRYVADRKSKNEDGTRNLAIWNIIEDTEELRRALTVPTQEEVVMARAQEAGARYGLKPALVELMFRWIIDRTVDVEVAYLQALKKMRDGE